MWDVGQATVICEFSLGNKTLVDMQWLDVSSYMYVHVGQVCSLCCGERNQFFHALFKRKEKLDCGKRVHVAEQSGH